MKHPVTTTLTIDEYEKLQNAKGNESMLKFVHDAIMSKCEACLNERGKKAIGHLEGRIEPAIQREQSIKRTIRINGQEVINDLDT